MVFIIVLLSIFLINLKLFLSWNIQQEQKKNNTSLWFLHMWIYFNLFELPSPYLSWDVKLKKIKKLKLRNVSEIIELKANNINPYLIDAKSILIPNRSKPICRVSEIATGNKPIDDGKYIFSDEERNNFIRIEPKAEKFIFPFLILYINGLTLKFFHLLILIPHF